MRTTITSLLLFCGPATVARLIVPVVIGVAIYCVLHRRPFAHIGKECLKRADPAVTNFYASLVVVLSRRLATARFHCYPANVGRSRRHARVSMYDRLDIPCSCNFGLEAATTENFASPQMRATNNSGSTTIALAKEMSLAVPDGVEANNGQPAEPSFGHFELSLLCHA